MIITKKLYLIILGLFFLTYFNSSEAQMYKVKGGSSKYASLSLNENITPGIVILKLKPEYREFTNRLELIQGHPSLAKIIGRFGVKKFTKVFPNSKEPVQSLNSRKQKPTDLSLLHVLEFNTAIPVGNVIEVLSSSGIFEYVEPEYIMQPLYTPNDPYSQPLAGGEILLKRINAFKAWDIETGDPNVVIGVLDTGTDLTHPDLAGNISYNAADPIDGIDNDLDGYIDNYNGWDVGMNDSDPSFQVTNHGVKVQGACSGIPDNGIGITGTGYNCKVLPLKITNSSGAITKGYEAIYYAADHGVKIINLSWGGYGTFSQAGQDIINYAAIDNDVLVVASAGNTEGDLTFYPASFDNVISVTGLDTIYSPMYDTLADRRKVNFVSYNFKVDLASMEGGISTFPGGTYGNFGGTSYAGPTVAGAAALVRSKYPALSALQAAELLRANGDLLDTFDITVPISRYKSGRKLNMYKALTNTTTPSVRMMNYTAQSSVGTGLFSGDTVTMTQDFFNYLSGTTNLKVRMLCNNGFATMVDSLSNLGIIDSIMSKNNNSDPFKFVINENAGSLQVIEFVLIMTDPSKNYYDYQGFSITVNPAYLDIDTNQVGVTITSRGRFGYSEYIPSPSQGNGVKYQATDLLYEGGFMIGASSSKVSDCIRENSFPQTVNNEFKSLKKVKYVSSTVKDQESYSVFNDSLASSIIGVEIQQRSFAWKNAPNDKFVILEYKIINKSSITYDSIFPGVFTDWDISNYTTNKADWNDANKVSYTYSSDPGTKVAGVALLTDNKPSCYSLEFGGVGGSINSYDSYTTIEKYNSLANGIARKKAGTSGAGNEVSQVTGARILDFAPGDTETVTFALIGADDIFELLDIAAIARDKYESFNKGFQPVIPDVLICEASDVTLAPINGNKFAFYETAPPATPVFVGPSYTYTNLATSKTVYIENRDYIFPSDVKVVQISADNMVVDFYPFLDPINALQGTPFLLVNQSSGAASISWDLGDATNSTSNIVSQTYNTAGDYTVELSAVSPLGCVDTKTRVVHVAPLTSTEALFVSGFSIFPNPVNEELSINFNEMSFPNDLTIELINAVGIQVYQSDEVNSNFKIDMSAYSSGVYYLKITSGKKNVNKMIIKK